GNANLKAQILFGSIAEWGPQAANYCRAIGHQYHVLALAETRVDAGGIGDLHGKLAMDGWKMAATPAVQIHKSDVGTHGGEWVLARRDVAATTFEGYREYYLQAYKRQPFVGFSPTILRTRSGNVIVVAACLRPGLRDMGANRDVLMSISTFIDMLADPWITLVDWNSAPPWWKDKPWLSRWSGAIVTDPACAATCDKGKGSIYDCAIVRSDIASRITVEVVYDVPCKPHCGMQVAIGDAEPWGYRAIKEFDALHYPEPQPPEDDAPFFIPDTVWGAAACTVATCPSSRATLWLVAAFGALMQRYTALVKNGKGVKARELIARRAQAMLIQIGSDDDRKKYFGPKGDPTEAEGWKLQVASLDFCDEHDLGLICATTQRWQHGAAARAAGRARMRYLDWAKRAWTDPPGKLRAIVKDPSPPKLETELHGVTFADPYTVMNRAASVWRQIWNTSSYDDHQIMQAYLEAMRRAREGPIPCIEPQRIYAVVSVADPKKARGVDNIGPLGIQRLPSNGINQLAQLYNFVEHAGLGPQRFCATVGAMAPEPA
ncbi:unnamed protein product, partial [Prorocentrum cordatum]